MLSGFDRIDITDSDGLIRYFPQQYIKFQLLDCDDNKNFFDTHFNYLCFRGSQKLSHAKEIIVECDDYYDSLFSLSYKLKCTKMCNLRLKITHFFRNN